MTVEIPLVNGRGIALIDDEDAPAVCRHRWYLVAAGYAMTGSGSSAVYMHRLIMAAPPGIEVDHRDRTRKLDNRRSNLRLATGRQNQGNAGLAVTNTSGYRGVSPLNGRWRAQIRDHGRVRHLGYFDDPAEAARAYDRAAAEVFGAFASLNFP